MSEEEFQKYPQLQGYMIEDVQFGGDDHAAWASRCFWIKS
jgi:hypothetical protein